VASRSYVVVGEERCGALLLKENKSVEVYGKGNWQGMSSFVERKRDRRSFMREKKGIEVSCRGR
jgi:hypothetical protein